MLCIFCDEFQAVGPTGTCDHCEPMPGAPTVAPPLGDEGKPAPSIVYRITYRRTGRIYVGVHKLPPGWADPFEDDGYQGSGEWIRAAIKKHKWSAFEKVVLAVLPTEEAALELEAGLVGPEQIASGWYFNLCEGGTGGLSGMSDEAKARQLEALRASVRVPEVRARKGAAQRERYANATPEQLAAWREAKAEGIREVTQTEEWRANNAAANRKTAQDPKWRANHDEVARRPEVRVKKSASLRRYFGNETPEERDARIGKTTDAARRPQTRAKKSAANYRRYANETTEERAARVEELTERMRALAQTEEWREAHAARCRTPEARAKTSAAQRKLCEDPAELERRSAVQLKRYANETPEQKVARGHAISEGFRRATPERRAVRVAAQQEGRRRAKAERERVKREVAMIFLALVAAKAA